MKKERFEKLISDFDTALLNILPDFEYFLLNREIPKKLQEFPEEIIQKPIKIVTAPENFPLKDSQFFGCQVPLNVAVKNLKSMFREVESFFIYKEKWRELETIFFMPDDKENYNYSVEILKFNDVIINRISLPSELATFFDDHIVGFKIFVGNGK